MSSGIIKLTELNGGASWHLSVNNLPPFSGRRPVCFQINGKSVPVDETVEEILAMVEKAREEDFERLGGILEHFVLWQRQLNG